MSENCESKIDITNINKMSENCESKIDITNINITNFDERFSEIKKSLEEASFIGFDLEFSSLQPLKDQTPSLFDTAQERYSKLRNNVKFVIPIQLGLTAFIYDSEKNSYKGKIYNFYLKPASFSIVQKSFMFQASSINFLTFHDFDFNKFAYTGIPFINRSQEEELRCKLNKGEITADISGCGSELRDIFYQEGKVVKKWYSTAKEGDKHPLPDLGKRIKEDYEMLYFVHQFFRKRFKVWTSLENDVFILEKLPTEVIRNLEKEQNLDEDIVTKILGFTRLFRLISSLQKPLVGHNCYQDILIMIEHFECPLPKSYNGFKKLVSSIFPVIYDTKYISREIKDKLHLRKQWRRDKGLQSLYEFSSDVKGEQLAFDSLKIESLNNGYNAKYHEAGWDSYCTGYIFLRMGFWTVYEFAYPQRSYESKLIFTKLHPFMNRINIISGSVNHMRLDGDDPVSTRPPFVVIESRNKAPLDIFDITTLLKKCGYMDIQPCPKNKYRVLVAFNNEPSAHKVMAEMRNHADYRIMKYSIMKHTWVGKASVVGGVTLAVIIMGMAWRL